MFVWIFAVSLNMSVVSFHVYHIYPKSSDTLTPYHTYPNKTISLPTDVFEKLPDIGKLCRPWLDAAFCVV